MTRARAARALTRGLVLALLAAVALLGWRPSPAFAEDAASCQSSGGVYVYIQPGGGGCSHTDGNGMTILRGLTSVNTNSTGMICQIGGYPDSCPDPVPTNDYWAYWSWSGTAWTYANVGAAADWPKPGEVRAWTFGDRARPSVTPPKPLAPSTVAATTSSATTTSTTTGGTASSDTTTRAPTTRATSTGTTTHVSTATATHAASARTPSPSASASGATPTGSPTPAAAWATPPGPGETGTATPIAVIATTPTSATPRGTPWGVVATVGLLLLAGAGILVARRRGRS